MPIDTGSAEEQSATGNGTASAGNEKPDSGTDRKNGSDDTLFGFEVGEPYTEKLDSGGSAPRRTKSGRIDGRTTRWRKSGTGEQADGTDAKESVHLSKLSITDVLYSLHLMGAEILSVPELKLDKDEAKKLGDAIAEVAKHYSVSFDPKKVAIFNLFSTAGLIYGTRLYAVRERRKTEVKPPLQKPTPIDRDKQQVPNASMFFNEGGSL